MNPDDGADPHRGVVSEVMVPIPLPSPIHRGRPGTNDFRKHAAHSDRISPTTCIETSPKDLFRGLSILLYGYSHDRHIDGRVWGLLLQVHPAGGP